MISLSGHLRQYTIRLTQAASQKAEGILKADLHGTTLSHTGSLRQAYDMNCFL